MKLRALFLALVMALALPGAASTSLADAWLRVQQELSAPQPGALDDRIQALQQVAQEVGAGRLTPYAAALVTWAQNHPGDSGLLAVGLAKRLDPELPSTSFLLARWQWQSGAYLRAAGSYLMGWVDLFRHGETRRTVILVGVLWLLFSLGVAVMVAVVLQIALYLRQMVHDATELGLVLCNRGNATVFAVVLVLLPVFAALGPLWLVAYLFALSWPYMGPARLAAAVSCCGLLALLGPTLEAWQQLALRVPPVTTRVTEMLEERRVDPSTVREFGDLEQDLQGVSRYELIMGELLRMHGDPSAAHLAFQQAAVADPGDPLPLVFLGNLAMEDGDVPRAIQQYTAAVRLDDRCAFAYHNLSFAYDQTYRFKESDEVRERARELVGQSLSTVGIPGRNPRLRYPRLGRADIAVMLSRVTPEMRLSAALDASRLRPFGLLLSPLATVFWVTGLIGFGALALRSTRWRWKAAFCARCGRVFCPRCKSATESASYCSQCISVFLKRDMVSIEQQTTKMAQIRRWEAWTTWSRRVVGALLPGSMPVLDDRVWLGLGLGVLGWTVLLGALVFGPRFLPAIEPQASATPLQALLLLGAAGIWGHGALRAWRR